MTYGSRVEMVGRIVGASLTTLVGFSTVVAALVFMNRPVDEPERDSRATTIDFSVPAPPEVEPPEPPEQRQETVRNRDRASVAPAPSLGGNLSGIAVAVPDFQVQGLSDVRESLLGDLDDVALTEDQVDTKPIPQSRPLEYPDRARQRRIEGRVVVSALIDVDGNVREVKILEADPPNVFETTVLNSVPNWTFEPAKYRGEPVQTWARIPIPFRLN